LLLFSLISALHCTSQIGGETAFPFMDLPYNARSAALGNDFITGHDNDVNMGVINPSMLNSEMHKTISVNQALLAGGVNFGMFNYGFNLKEYGTMASYVKYVSYGKFERTNVNGTSEGTFSPIEFIVGSSFGREINKRLSIGTSANILYSQLETYSSLGVSIDFAGAFRNEEKGFLVTAMVKNIGAQITRYNSALPREKLPTEVQMAVAYKLPHAPFRISLLGHHLNQWDITYNDPNLQPTLDPLTGDTIPVSRPGFGEKLAQHFTYQLETLISERIHFRAAFDYYRRKALAISQRPGAAGISLGLGLNFSKFSIDYGFTIYSQAGFNNILTIRSDLSKWRR
ncbi:MAG: type IX secretion system protein PorQ, partial [Crocinitomicaceae bacterium]|nr:type IX secretion system protein PorQ [Crocinitomicaceae bacterium]